MDNVRIFAWAALAFVLFLNYQAWQRDYPSTPVPTGSAPATSAETPPEDALPTLPNETTATDAPAAPAAPTPAPPATAAVERAPAVHVVTDVLDMEISTRGGELIRADLLRYPKVKGEADECVC